MKENYLPMSLSLYSFDQNSGDVPEPDSPAGSYRSSVRGGLWPLVHGEQAEPYIQHRNYVFKEVSLNSHGLVCILAGLDAK